VERMLSLLRPWRCSIPTLSPSIVAWNGFHSLMPHVQVDGDQKCIEKLKQREVGSIGVMSFVVTQYTTACYSMQVVDITLVKYHFTNITSLRVVQQKHSGLYSST
jgi:hypothetical protein